MAANLPPPTFFDQISQYFSRRDKLLEYIAVTDKQLLDTLVAMLKAQGVAVPPSLAITVTAPPVTVTAPAPIILPGPPTPSITSGLRVTPVPTGSIVASGTLAVPTTTYQTLASYVPNSGKRFQLAKIAVTCAEDIIVQLFWAEQAISLPYYVMGKLPFTDWFPIDYYSVTHSEYLAGNGKTKLELKAKIPSGGTTSQVDGQIVGEET